MRKLIYALLIVLSLFFFTLSHVEGRGGLLGGFMGPISSTVVGGGASPEDTVLWDASGDMIFWDASGDEILWNA
jgi:hypothetical protein